MQRNFVRANHDERERKRAELALTVGQEQSFS